MANEHIAWHPGFASAMQLELGAYRDRLAFETEHELNRQPLRVDLLVVKKPPDVVIQGGIGSLLKSHNIFEFKSESDGLTIDDLYKATAYGCLYKAYGPRVDSIRADSVMVALVRRGRPNGLFASLESYGKAVSRQACGIYQVDGMQFETWVIVTAEIDPEEYVWLASLASDLETIQLKRLVDASLSLQDAEERELADSVLNVVALANTGTLERLKKEDEMGKTLYEIRRPEIDAAAANARIEGMEKGLARGMEAGMEKGMEKGMALGVQEGRLDAIAATVKRMLSRGGFSEAEIADLSGADVERVRSIAASMGVQLA